MLEKFFRKSNIIYSAASVFWKGMEAENIAQILGNLKGPVMKVGQLLAMVPGLLSEEFQSEFSKLQQTSPEMGKEFVKRRMSQELGANWEKLFDEFEIKPRFAASIGQVHYAVADGRALACKLQYPNIEKIAESDIEQVFGFVKFLSKFKRPLILDPIFEELKEKLLQECDYLNESKNISDFKEIYKNHPNIKIPEVIHEKTTKHLLTMQWMESDNINELKNKSEEERKYYLKLLFKAWYYSFYKFGLIHADPHAGNFGFKNDSVFLYDFGCVKRLDKNFINGVLSLREAFLEGSKKKEIEAYELWGFQDFDYEMLNSWAKFVYAPTLEDKDVILDSSYTKSAKNILQEIFKKASEKGGIKLPRSFLLFDRATVGMGSAFMNLNVKVNYYQLLEETLALDL